MNWLRRLFGRPRPDDRVIQAYRIGLREGMDIMQRAILANQYRRALAVYPDADHGNVVSFRAAALRVAQYKPTDAA